MSSSPIQKILIFFILLFLTATAFIVRLKVFQTGLKYDGMLSIDEVVYYRLGKQLKTDFPKYNTIEYAAELEARGRSLPEYFIRPLFKYPPVFAGLIALSMSIFGISLTSAFYVSLLFGVLMIPLIYLLGKLVFDERAGLLAAVFMWMDPVSIICSQKIWMETTLAFFTVAAIYVFILGVKRNKHNLFIISGVLSGLATATKYPGLLATIIVGIWALSYDRALFKNKKFVFSLFIPGIMLIPWLFWNYVVSNDNFFSLSLGLHSCLTHSRRLMDVLVISLLCIPLIWAGVHLLKKLKNDVCCKNSKPARLPLKFIFCAAFFLIIHKHILYAFTLGNTPLTSWGNISGKVSSLFYFGQLIEFSPLYIISFMALCYFGTFEDRNKGMITLSSALIMLFYLVWGNYQSRYILACLPMLVLLASYFIVLLTKSVFEIKPFIPRLLSKSVLTLTLLYLFLKTMLINVLVSFPNDFCYF